MTLHTFKDHTVFIVGLANNKIESSISGTLSIGNTNIYIPKDLSVDLPSFPNGSHRLKWVSDDGTEYNGGYINVLGGRVIPHKNLTARECELMHRLDVLESHYEDLAAKYAELYDKYNTNALNFISD